MVATVSYFAVIAHARYSSTSKWSHRMIRLLERLELTTSSRRMEGAQHHKKIALDVWKANLTRMEGQTRRWWSLPLFYVAHLLPIGMLSSPDICEWIPPPSPGISHRASIYWLSISNRVGCMIDSCMIAGCFGCSRKWCAR